MCTDIKKPLDTDLSRIANQCPGLGESQVIVGPLNKNCACISIIGDSTTGHINNTAGNIGVDSHISGSGKRGEKSIGNTEFGFLTDSQNIETAAVGAAIDIVVCIAGENHIAAVVKTSERIECHERTGNLKSSETGNAG